MSTSWKRLPVLVTVVLAGALVALAWRGMDVHAAGGAGASACTQWQTAIYPDAVDLRAPLPEAGKPMISTGPVGWEPFAFGPSGQLVYRRCTK